MESQRRHRASTGAFAFSRAAEHSSPVRSVYDAIVRITRRKEGLQMACRWLAAETAHLADAQTSGLARLEGFKQGTGTDHDGHLRDR